MLCPFCNKEIPDNAEFCQYCGKQVKKVENNTENNTNVLGIFIPIVQIIFVLLIMAFIKVGYKTFVSPKIKAMARPPINKTEVKNATFVRVFYLSNTESLKAFCRDTGYIPNDFINLFSFSFQNSIKNADNILVKNGFNKKELDNSSTINKKTYAEYEKDYNNAKIIHQEKNNNLYTKEDYCKMYDINAKNLVTTKINMFKNAKPELFFD